MDRDDVVAMLENLAAEVNRGGTKYHRLALDDPTNTGHSHGLDYGWVSATDRTLRLIQDLKVSVGG